ncbi:MAG TPA: type II secretion system protein [Candidatus Saccharimonadales bacterium]|nr:type II secretion system protein [Candidatus Saccharimonadales bacterium]
MKKLNNGKGFTIIEVVLVLAIAGLIFLVVFLALPALQRGQRDTQRKNDLGRFMSQVTSYSSNNQGNLPTSATAWNTMISNYLTVNSANFSDPSSGATYSVPASGGYNTAAPASPVTVQQGEIKIYTNSRCGGTNGVETSTGSRNIAAVIYQEQGGFYCLDNR